MSRDKKILFHQQEAVGYIVINNPDRRNAISLAMWQDLAAAAQDLATAEGCRAVVVRGAGGAAFAAGADISEFDGNRADVSAVEVYDGAVMAACHAVGSLQVPTIALIEGYCIGGGLGLALCCDLRLAAEDARFAIPAARLGVAYRFDLVAKLVSVVGSARAKDILLTARMLGANEALAMGLVNRVSPSSGLDDLLANYLAKLTVNAPLTLAAVKQAVDQLAMDPEQRDMARIERLEAACATSGDYVEGRRAFQEGRPPRFQGR
ncbi:MAG: enoyl-CoA hydratase [Alphaproteobacteria bacterium]